MKEKENGGVEIVKEEMEVVEVLIKNLQQLINI